jgi:hypothetical protein
VINIQKYGLILRVNLFVIMVKQNYTRWL